MKLPYGAPLVVVNPRAGRQSSDTAGALVDLFRDLSIAAQLSSATSRDGLRRICEHATGDGVGFIIVVGGDGTLRDAVNGVLSATPNRTANERPVLGIVGTGTGSDFARTYGLDRDVNTLFAHMMTDAVTLVDIGHVTAGGVNNRQVSTYFVNVAQAGFGATVTKVAAKLPSRLGANRYRLAVPAALARFRHHPMRLSLDNTMITDNLLNVVVANGQFYGAGLHVAPQALPHDGVFDVQAWQVSPQELAVAHEQLKHGTHLARDGVRQWRSTTVTVHSPRSVLVEADGDVVGVTPATFAIKPHALRVKI